MELFCTRCTAILGQAVPFEGETQAAEIRLVMEKYHGICPNCGKPLESKRLKT